MTTEPLDDFLNDALDDEADLDDPFAGDGVPSVPGDVEESYLDEDDAALWEGDRGTLDGRQRDVLISLLKKAFVSSDDRAEWRVLTRDPGPIAANLNNLYLKLVIDDRSEVAYAAPVRTADNSFKTLVRDTPNNREETLLLMYLRERFRAATAAGDPHVFTDGAAMYDYVQRFRPSHATDRVGDERRVDNAITSLTTAGLLVRTRDDGRYRVHRAIEALLPLPKLQHLLEAFRTVNSSEPTDEESDGYAGKHAAAPALDDPLEEAADLEHDDPHPDSATGADIDSEEEQS